MNCPLPPVDGKRRMRGGSGGLQGRLRPVSGWQTRPSGARRLHTVAGAAHPVVRGPAGGVTTSDFPFNFLQTDVCGLSRSTFFDGGKYTSTPRFPFGPGGYAVLTGRQRYNDGFL